MEKIKTPLTMVTAGAAIGALDGAFSWGLSDDLYIVVGIAMIWGLIWMWRIVSKDEKKV